MYENFNFRIESKAKGSKARNGVLKTPHGEIKTPAFIFCATKGAIKGLDVIDMLDTGTQFILSNTYHLFVNPGPDYIAERGGLHKFMGWDGPILTDSGGFQIFSLGHGSVASEIKGKRLVASKRSLLSIDENGAIFKSYKDGANKILTPEKSIEIQRKLGSDIILVLDECTPFHVSKEYTRKSMEMSHRWALRSLKEFERGDNGTQALYGIVQGGIYEDLRIESTKFVNDLPFFGIAIGGSLGDSKEKMFDVVNFTRSLLTNERPVHLLGIGGIRDIFEGVKAGIDTFDCVHPTRLARHGGAIVRRVLRESDDREHINIKNSKKAKEDFPIDENCECRTCKLYSRSYLNYLFKAKELLAVRALSIHNVAMMNRVMEDIRRAIINDDLHGAEKIWL